MSKQMQSDEITAELAKLDDWSLDEKHIKKQLKFKDFKTCFSFMTAAALYAEQNNHHPEWFNVYNSLDISLSTHDAGGLTEKDFKFAAYIDELTKRFKD